MISYTYMMVGYPICVPISLFAFVMVDLAVQKLAKK